MSTYVPIQAITLSSTASSVIFSGIPQSYTDLILVCGTAGLSASDFIARMQLNSDTGNNYSFTELYGNGTSAASTRDSNRSNIPIAYNVGLANDNNANIIVQFMNYSNTITNKTVLVRENRAAAGTGAIVGLWRSSSAINTIKIECGGASSWTSGSTFTLYGISSGTQKASGGEIYVSSGYAYHVFRQSGIFSPSTSISADVLVIAGGGAGGGTNTNGGGGGGAGGIVYATNQTITNDKTVQVGSGGTGASDARGSSGTDSYFGSILAKGGGGGGASSVNNEPGLNGGSGGGGGGGAANAGTGGTAQAGTGGTSYGNNGGIRTIAATGGGGGAGAAGASPGGSSTGGAGGAGLNTWSAWATATNTGVSGFYAGGGGAGYTSGGAGGAGGGGAGGSYSTDAGKTAGTTNTGGGGGGSSVINAGAGANGGSGLVIVRYAL